MNQVKRFFDSLPTLISIHRKIPTNQGRNPANSEILAVCLDFGDRCGRRFRWDVPAIKKPMNLYGFDAPSGRQGYNGVEMVFMAVDTPWGE